MRIIGMLVLCFCFLAAMGQNSEPLKAGMQTVDFSYRDVDGNTVNLKDLRGKYVYIDVWATWCMPCRGELPDLKELKKKMEKKNICFVCISCDKDVEKWKQMVKDDGLTGIQVNTGGDQTFMKAYGIRAIPRFILIDPEGKIVNPEMSRPSQTVTLETLMNLKGI